MMHWPCHNSGMMLLVERIFSKSGACLQPGMANQPTRGPVPCNSVVQSTVQQPVSSVLLAALLPHHWLRSRLRNLYIFPLILTTGLCFYVHGFLFLCLSWIRRKPHGYIYSRNLSEIHGGNSYCLA